MDENYEKNGEGLTEGEESIAEESDDCPECDGTGYIDVGAFDDIRTERCPFCNPKIESDMDDDS